MFKQPLVAAVLNVIFPGIAYLYLGDRKLFGGLLLSATILSYFWFFSDPSAQNLYNSAIVSMATVLLALAFAIDAYREAKKAS
jgi:hypothetical protein